MTKKEQELITKLQEIAEQRFEEMLQARDQNNLQRELELKGWVSGLITAQNVIRNAS